jgi:hypothetical protein
MTFDSRLSLADHLVIADYGRAHLRYRTGLVAAIEAYGLALYSTYHLGQGPNWWRAGLEHYAYARGGRLLFMLIHHPEDNLGEEDDGRRRLATNRRRRRRLRCL